MRRKGHDALATFNERVKLLASSVNTVGLGMIGLAVIRPLIDSLDNATSKTGLWLAAGLVMHALSHYILRYLRKDQTP